MSVRVFVEPTGRRIEPFDDPPADVPVQNRPLSQWQEEAFRDADLVRIPSLEPPCLVVPDAFFASAGALSRFAEGAGGEDAVLVLADSLFARRTTPVQPGVSKVAGGHRFDAVRFVSGRGAPPREVAIDPEEKVVEIPMPARYMEEGKLEISLPRHPVMTIHHWIHILAVNQAAGAMGLRQTPGWKGAARVGLAVLRAGSINKWKVLRRLSTFGRGCDVHPTAVVEGSTLGDRVTVGPHARVLFSHVGSGAMIMAGAQVEACTLGERSMVNQATVLRLCVLYPEAIAGQQLMQQCVLGRGAVTTLGAYCIDLNFERDVRVPLDGAMHPAGTRFLGAAIGHGARLGTGFWMASGRSIPNGVFVVRPPREVIARIPSDLPPGLPVAIDEGTLRPVPRAPAGDAPA